MDRRRFAALALLVGLELACARFVLAGRSFVETYEIYTAFYRQSGLSELVSNTRLAIVLLVLGVAVGGPMIEAAKRSRKGLSHGFDPLRWQPFAALLGLGAVAAARQHSDLVYLGILASLFAAGLTLAALVTKKLVWTDVLIPTATLFGISLASVAAGALMHQAWEPASRTTLRMAAAILGVVGVPVSTNPSTFVLASEGFGIVIEKACSGLEGMGLAAVMMSGFLLVCRHDLRFPAAFALVPIGLGAAYLMNAARIAALFGVGAFISVEVATKGFHHNAGWLGFNAVILGLMVYAQKSRVFARDSLASSTRFLELPITAFLAPLIVLLATVLTTGAMIESFDWLYGVRIVTVGIVLHLFRRSYGAGRWSASPLAIASGLAVAVVWIAAHEFRGDHASDATLAAALGGAPPLAALLWIMTRVVGSVVVIPLVEELAFRGFLMRRLDQLAFETRRYGDASLPAVLFSSIAFGAVHDQWIVAAAAGAIFALLAKRGQGLGPAVTAHAVANLAIAFFALGTGRFSLWA